MRPPEWRCYLIEIPSGFVEVLFNDKGIYGLFLKRKEPVSAEFACVTKSEFYWPELEREIKAYFNGRPITGDYPLIMSDYTPWTLKILQLTRKIPFGKTVTYKYLAEKAGSPLGARAAGRALARNRTPILIPCHRVVGERGKLVGFSCGIDWKKELLELEGSLCTKDKDAIKDS